MKVLDIDGLNYYDGKIKQTYAPLASPALTGNPTATTQTKTDNSTKLATTAFVKNNLNDYAMLNGATFTGAVNGVTPTAGDNSTKLATTAYVQAELADYVTLNDLSTELGDYLPLAGGTLTGDLALTDYHLIEVGVDMHTSGQGGTLCVIDNGLRLSAENGSINLAGAYIDLNGRTGRDGRFLIAANNSSGNSALIGNVSGTLTWNGIDLTPQTYSIKNPSSDVNVASGSIKNLLSFSITKGTWLVQAVASFPNNSSGYRRLGIATSSSSAYMDRYSVQTTPAASGVPTQLTFTTCLKTSGTNAYYLNAYQTSGSTLAVTAGVLLFRLSNTAS